MDELKLLFDRYRAACPDPEPSANFMPSVWRGIDRRRGFARQLWSYTRGLATASAAACVVLLALQFAPAPASGDLMASTYVDLLGADLGPETTAFAEFSLGER
jgi:hypothetical protein